MLSIASSTTIGKLEPTFLPPPRYGLPRTRPTKNYSPLPHNERGSTKSRRFLFPTFSIFSRKRAPIYTAIRF
jgi:hypothetical protein